MKHLYPQHSLFVLITIIVFGNWCVPASGQVDPVVIDLRDRLIENKGEEYIEARNEALELPQGAFNDLLFLLKLAPEYSLEHILALILEARANHPEEAARFDQDYQDMVDNPDMTGRHGRPIYRIWTNREPNEMHPFAYEVHIKMPIKGTVLGLTLSPNPQNIPFILYFAKHHNPGALYDLVTVTDGYPEEREWLRPLAVQIYKEHREAGVVAGGGVVSMFQQFGTQEDLGILKELRDYEAELMPQQGLIIGDRQEVNMAAITAAREYEKRKTDLARAQREGAPPAALEQLEQQLAEAESTAIELRRQQYANILWNALDEAIERLESRLQDAENGS